MPNSPTSDNHSACSPLANSSQAGELHSPNGCHILLECSGCSPELLCDKERLETYMTSAAKDSGATVIKTVFHTFSPQGVSGVVVIAESHVTVHTWPESGYAAFDIFTCGQQKIARRIQKALLEFTQPQHTNIREFQRSPTGSKLISEQTL